MVWTKDACPGSSDCFGFDFYGNYGRPLRVRPKRCPGIGEWRYNNQCTSKALGPYPWPYHEEDITRGAPTALARHGWSAGWLALSACIGQHASDAVSSWVWWYMSRTDLNHGHGCSQEAGASIGASQPEQLGSIILSCSISSCRRCRSQCARTPHERSMERRHLYDTLARRVLVRVETAIKI